MNNSNRDLLVLFNQELMTPQSIEHEVELLHQLLYTVESLITAHEVIDLNKYKVTNKTVLLRKIFRQRELKPFVFLNCKN
jgi:predicted house-cleaning NTP pyrophosphatase (Maf/HAM1 superfamily)